MEPLSWGRGQGTDARCPLGPWSDHTLHRTDGAWGSCLAGLLLRTAGSQSHVIKWSCSMCVCCVCVHSVVSGSAALWTVARQAPLSVGLSRHGYWSGLPCSPPGGLPDPGVEPASLKSPGLAGGSLPLMPPVQPGHPNTQK